MRLMRFAVAAFAGVVLLSGCTEKPKVLRVYTWYEYTAPELVAAFERKYDCTVEIVTFDTNEDMIAKLHDEGCGDYDIILPSAYFVPQMAKERLILPIDHAKCPSVKRNFLKEYAKMMPEDPELRYSVPYGIAHSGLMCATNRIPAGVDVSSWTVLGNPALKGHVFMVDDMREVLGIALISRGCSPNTEDAGEIAAAADQVLRWMPNVAQWGGDDTMFSSSVDGNIWAWLAYGDTAKQIIADRGSADSSGLVFIAPREGCLFTCDVLTVSSGCRNADLAYAFIEFLYSDLEAGLAHMDYNSFLLPCAPALEEVSPDLRKLAVPTPEVLSHGQVLRGFDDKPEVLLLYEKAWERVVKGR